jgi:tetratricopeptide (TPR) repeat protein
MDRLERMPIWVAIAVITLLGGGVYMNSLDGEFLWDDNYLIKNNAYIKSMSDIPRFFTENIASGGRRRWNAYRPLQMITYAAEYGLWGLDPGGYHLTNIILHILTALGVYWLVSVLFRDRTVSLITGVLFAIHPVHTEAVSYVSGRADPLCAVFLLLAMVAYIRWPGAGGLVITLLAYALALLSRESALILPVLLLLYHYAFRKRLQAGRFLPVCLLAAAYISLRMTVLKGMLANIEYDTTLMERFPGFMVAITNYLRFLLLPIGLHSLYEHKLFPMVHREAVAGVFIFLALLFAAFRARRSDRCLFFSIAWFFITLLPQSNLYPVNAYMSDHWLYLPSIGFFLVIARAIKEMLAREKYRVYGFLVLGGLAAFYSVVTFKQNNYWSDPRTFYERTIRYTPGNARLYNNLGVIYTELGMKEKAFSAFKRAAEMNPDRAEAYVNLGGSCAALGHHEKAIESYLTAIEKDPMYTLAYDRLEQLYNELGMKEGIVELCLKAVNANPESALAYYKLGYACDMAGKPGEAVDAYRKALELKPDYSEAHNNLGIAYYKTGKLGEALASYKRAIESDPQNADSYNNLGGVFFMTGRIEEAIAAYKKAIELDPAMADAYYNLGTIYEKIGKIDEAEAFKKRAREIRPEYAD